RRAPRCRGSHELALVTSGGGRSVTSIVGRRPPKAARRRRRRRVSSHRRSASLPRARARRGSAAPATGSGGSLGPLGALLLLDVGRGPRHALRDGRREALLDDLVEALLHRLAHAGELVVVERLLHLGEEVLLLLLHVVHDELLERGDARVEGLVFRVGGDQALQRDLGERVLLEALVDELVVHLLGGAVEELVL